MLSSSARGRRGGQSSTLVLSEQGGGGGGGFALGSFTELAHEFRTLDHGEEIKTQIAPTSQDVSRTEIAGTSRELSEEVSQVSEAGASALTSARGQTNTLINRSESPRGNGLTEAKEGWADVDEQEHHGPAFFCGLGGSLERSYAEVVDNRDTISKISRMMGYWARIHWTLAIAGHFLGWEGWSHVVCYLALGETLAGIYTDYHMVRLLARLAQVDPMVYDHPEEVCRRPWRFFGRNTRVSLWIVALLKGVVSLPDELLDAGVVGLTFGEGPWSVSPESSELIDDLGFFGWIFHIGIGWALLIALDLSLLVQAGIFLRSQGRIHRILDTGGSESSALSCLIDMADIASLSMTSEVIKRIKKSTGAADYSNNACFYTKTLLQNSLQLSFSVSLLHLVHRVGDRREVANVLLAIATGSAVTLTSTKNFVTHGLTNNSSHGGLRCCCGLFFVVPVVLVLLVNWARLALMFL